MDSRPPLFERWIVRPARPWIPAGIAALLLLAAVGAVALDGALGEFLDRGQWCGLVIAPSVILYIVIIAPVVSHADRQVPLSLRPLILLGDDDFDRLSDKRAYIRPNMEMTASALGAVVGRQSLLLALVFIGGITLSLLFHASQPDSMRSIQFWLVYSPPAIVPVAVFFLNMLPTHRVLAETKRRELAAAHRHMLQEYRDMQSRLAAGGSDAAQVAEATLLLAYEQRLREARIWPYNTTMLRTLFFSVLLPIGLTLLQKLWSRLFF